MTRDRWRDLLLLVLLGAAFRIVLMLVFPAPYGNDAIGRLYFKDQLFLSHWLPLAQSLVWIASRVSHDILLTRVLFALVGALSAGGFYLYLREIVSRDAARLGGALFCFNGLYVVLSLMPYQGPLFLGLYYGALALLFRAPQLASTGGSLLYGLAALTRYEGWFALPILGACKLIRDLRRWTLGDLAVTAPRVLLFFGWGPLLWFTLSSVHWGEWSGFLFQGPGHSFYGWNPHFDLKWTIGYAGRMLYWILSFGSPLTLLAVWGAVRLIRREGGAPASVRILLWNALLTLLFFFFIIGREQETVFRFVLFPLSVALVLTTFGLEGLLERLSQLPRFPVRSPGIIVAASVVLALAAGVRVYRVTQEPEAQAPYAVAQFLETNLGPGESALVVAERSRDPNEAAPMGFQRIAAISGQKRPRILSSGVLSESRPQALQEYARGQGVRYLVRFTDFEPWVPADRFFIQLPDRHPERFQLVLKTQLVEVFRVLDWPVPQP